ncbi:MAG TPA: lipopolysaccharide biosynthesis protein [Rhodanobacteraceae bacterium]|nr:lipopolysaccharide biosynthesis protein [Rhodanobacteraceae bacterium]
MKGPIARGTIRTTFVLGLRLLVQAGTLLLVARMLGPHQFGAFAGVAALAVMLGTLSTFGTHLVLLGEVSKESTRREHVLPYAVPSTLLCGGVLLAIYLLICTFALSESNVAIDVLLAIGITEMLLQPLFALPASEHLALGRVARSQLLQTLPLALRFAAAAAVFLLHPVDPLAAYAYGYLAASVIALGIATTTMPGPWPALGTWRLPTRTELRETAGYAALGITATSPAELDKTLAIKLLPLAASGLYAVGARVIGAATLPVIAMMLSALPRLFREGLDQPHRTARLLRWIFAAALAYSFALAVVLWFIAPAFVWLFGAKYQGIQHTIHWLCLAVPGMALRLAVGGVLMALGKTWMRVGFEVTGLVVLVIAAVVLTAHFGATGMPLALACSEWVMAAMGLSAVFASRSQIIRAL